MTELVDKGWITIMQMAEKMSYNPAKILGLDKGAVEEGKAADLVVFDAGKEYTTIRRTSALDHTLDF